jgi:hypothetical protein
MAQLATVLPTDDILSAADGGVTYSTTIYDGSTSLEQRNQNWTTPRQAWSLTYVGLVADIQPVVDLFDEAFGMALSFLFTPPGGVQGDYRFAQDQISPSYQAGAGGLIGTVNVSVIEVLGE